MTPQLVVLRGLPASGKSTYAKKLVAENDETVRLNRDDFRITVTGKEWGLHAWEEALITDAHRTLAIEYLSRGYRVIIDSMNLRSSYLNYWGKLCHEMDVDLTVVDFPVYVDEAVQRDAARDRHVGEDVIRMLAAKLTDNGTPRPFTGVS